MFFSYLLYIYYLLQSYCLFLNNKAEGQINHGVPAKLFSLTPLLLRDLFASAEGSCLRSLGGEEVFRQRNFSPLSPCLLRVYFCLRVYLWSKFRRKGVFPFGLAPQRVSNKNNTYNDVIREKMPSLYIIIIIISI